MNVGPGVHVRAFFLYTLFFIVFDCLRISFDHSRNNFRFTCIINDMLLCKVHRSVLRAHVSDI